MNNENVIYSRRDDFGIFLKFSMLGKKKWFELIKMTIVIETFMI